MSVDVKICGLGTAKAVTAAVEGGARFVGFVFFAASPRHVTPEQAGALTRVVPEGITRVGLVVDADDAMLDAIVSRAGVDLLQLHGGETPERTAEIRRRFGLPVMKVLPVAGPGDVERAGAYAGIADRLMFDARPPKGSTRPGGNALVFDWELLRGRRWPVPWILAGGLDAGNVAVAVRTSGAPAVDVSSGVEDSPGHKNSAKIRSFLAAAAAL